MRNFSCAVLLVVSLGFPACSRVQPHVHIPRIALGDASFYPTIEAYTRAPIMAGNKVTLLLNGEQFFPAMLEAIRGARQTINYVQYSWEHTGVSSDFVEALAERCRAGVAVNLLLDGTGALRFPAEPRAMLTGAGCHVASFRPVGPLTLHRTNNRTHRRILIIDGRTAFTGGSGVSEKWEGDGRTEGKWRDTDVRIDGPVVQQLQAAFAENWLEATGVVLGNAAHFPPDVPIAGEDVVQVVSSSPARGASEMYTTFLLAINSARRSIRITNPYFLPDDALMEALLAARRRGVHVQVLLPGQIDHQIVRQASRAGFEPLFQADVEIFEYQPALLHAKTMVIDGTWSTIGSANFDNRSFSLNDELNVVIYGSAFGSLMDGVFAQDVRRAQRIAYEDWQSRPITDRLVELIVLPIRDLL
jgi:cardiolipin synthase